ncbi:hypothetical protein J4Y99_26670, partial [Escherichia coli]
KGEHSHYFFSVTARYRAGVLHPVKGRKKGETWRYDCRKGYRVFSDWQYDKKLTVSFGGDKGLLLLP